MYPSPPTIFPPPFPRLLTFFPIIIIIIIIEITISVHWQFFYYYYFFLSNQFIPNDNSLQKKKIIITPLPSPGPT